MSNQTQTRLQISPEFVRQNGEVQVSIMYNQLGEQVKKLQSIIRSVSNQFDEATFKIDEFKKSDKKIKKEFDEMIENLPLAADYIAKNEDFLKLPRDEQSKIISELIWSNILQIKKLNDYTNERYSFFVNKIIEDNAQRAIDEFESIETTQNHKNPEEYFKKIEESEKEGKEIKNQSEPEPELKIDETMIDFLE